MYIKCTLFFFNKHMETIEKFRTLTDNFFSDAKKFLEKDNKQAGLRARKYANQVRLLMTPLRKELTEEINRRNNATIE